MKEIFVYIMDFVTNTVIPVMQNTQEIDKEANQATADIVAAIVESGFCTMFDPKKHIQYHMSYEGFQAKGLIKDDT